MSAPYDELQVAPSASKDLERVRAETVAEIVRCVRRIAAEETLTRHTIGMVADFIEREFAGGAR